MYNSCAAAAAAAAATTAAAAAEFYNERFIHTRPLTPPAALKLVVVKLEVSKSRKQILRGSKLAKGRHKLADGGATNIKKCLKQKVELSKPSTRNRERSLCENLGRKQLVPLVTVVTVVCLCLWKLLYKCDACAATAVFAFRQALVVAGFVRLKHKNMFCVCICMCVCMCECE